MSKAHTVKDPIIKQRVIQLAVGFAIGPLKRNPQFAFKVFDYILDTRCPADPAYAAYTDAVSDLQAFSLHQLQRLAMRFPDYLIVSGASGTLCKVLTSLDHIRRSGEKDRVRQSDCCFR